MKNYLILNYMSGVKNENLLNINSLIYIIYKIVIIYLV